MMKCKGRSCSNPEIKTPYDVGNCKKTISSNYPAWNRKCFYQRGQVGARVLNILLDVMVISLAGVSIALFMLNNVADSIYFTVVAVLINSRGLRV